ncbi:MAG: hypothetical protein ACTTJW_05610, partial [Sphaerochaeta sp.]
LPNELISLLCSKMLRNHGKIFILKACEYYPILIYGVHDMEDAWLTQAKTTSRNTATKHFNFLVDIDEMENQTSRL